MVKIRNISYSYGKAEVLRDISFDVQAGECAAILGANGAGKSTLITCLNKIRTPKTGSVYVGGQDILKLSRLEVARLVSYVAQKSEISRATVFDAVLLGRKPYIKWGVSQQDIDICEELIGQAGIASSRYIDELSGGELQKVMLARALVQQPKLLLLDEPASNLDPKNQHEMLAQVQNLARERGISALIVLHDLNLALRYCDRFLFIKSGLVYSYGGEAAVSEEAIAEVYGLQCELLRVNGRKIVVIS